MNDLRIQSRPAFISGVFPARFNPAPWCRGPHLQTIWPFAFRRPAVPAYRRERIELEDGDFIDIDWRDTSGPVVMLLHGLAGCSRSHYIMGLVHALEAAGYSSAVMHFRGCSGEPNRLARSYHAGESGDVDTVIKHLTNERQLLAAIGFSLGGNALLKWAGEAGSAAPINTIVAVSVPYRLDRAASRMMQGASRIYQKRLIALLHKTTRAHLSAMDSPVDIQALDAWTDFYSFDNNVTAPLHGFKDVDDYYTRASSRQFLKSIEVPTLLLHAKDDPFMTADTAPVASDLSVNTRLELAQSGGHVGFVGGTIRPRYWLEERILEHLGIFKAPASA